MKPFLVLQLRPEAEAADDEYAAMLQKGALRPEDTHRIRLDIDPLPDDLDLDDFSGVIVGGGPGCVSDPLSEKDPVERRIEEAVFSLMPEVTSRDIPFMGCCYGIGILAHHLGASVNKENYSEPVGATTCEMTDAGRADPLMSGLPETFRAFVGHKEAVQELPQGCAHLASSDPCPFQVIRYGENVYATQFHPELDSYWIERRVHIYKNHGYFPPEKAEELIELGHRENVTVPEALLRRFVNRYARD